MQLDTNLYSDHVSALSPKGIIRCICNSLRVYHFLQTALGSGGATQTNVVFDVERRGLGFTWQRSHIVVSVGLWKTPEQTRKALLPLWFWLVKPVLLAALTRVPEPQRDWLPGGWTISWKGFLGKPMDHGTEVIAG